MNVILNEGLPQIKRRGLMMVLSSPSGAGKSSLSRALLKSDMDINLSISVTTRAPRSGEVDGVDYHFISKDRYQEMVEKSELLEHAAVFDNFYGTPREPVMAALAIGKDVLFDIDWQGAQQLTEQAKEDLVKIFILPPSIAALKNRLQTRAQDSDAVVAKRMEKASDELSHFSEYDWTIINQDFELSLEQIKAILASERLRKKRQEGIGEFVRRLRDQAAGL